MFDDPAILKMKISLVFFHSSFKLFATYKNPVRNLKNTSMVKLVAKLEKNVAMNDRIRVGTMTYFRPRQSDKYPQKYELTIIPIELMPDKTPLFAVVSFKSQSATGNTKLMPNVSNDVAVMIIPDITMRM